MPPMDALLAKIEASVQALFMGGSDQ